MYSVNLGALRSSPNSTTFLFDKESAAAKLIDAKVFPSPTVVDVIKIVFPEASALFGNIKSKLVRINLNASAILVLESFPITILEPESE